MSSINNSQPPRIDPPGPSNVSNASASEGPIARLPDPILNLIFNFLPEEDRRNASLVSRKWRVGVLSANQDDALKLINANYKAITAQLTTNANSGPIIERLTEIHDECSEGVKNAQSEPEIIRFKNAFENEVTQLLQQLDVEQVKDVFIGIGNRIPEESRLNSLNKGIHAVNRLRAIENDPLNREILTTNPNMGIDLLLMRLQEQDPHLDIEEFYHGKIQELTYAYSELVGELIFVHPQLVTEAFEMLRHAEHHEIERDISISNSRLFVEGYPQSFRDWNPDSRHPEAITHVIHALCYQMVEAGYSQAKMLQVIENLNRLVDGQNRQQLMIDCRMFLSLEHLRVGKYQEALKWLLDDIGPLQGYHPWDLSYFFDKLIEMKPRAMTEVLQAAKNYLERETIFIDFVFPYIRHFNISEEDRWVIHPLIQLIQGSNDLQHHLLLFLDPAKNRQTEARENRIILAINFCEAVFDHASFCQWIQNSPRMDLKAIIDKLNTGDINQISNQVIRETLSIKLIKDLLFQDYRLPGQIDYADCDPKPIKFALNQFFAKVLSLETHNGQQEITNRFQEPLARQLIEIAFAQPFLGEEITQEQLIENLITHTMNVYSPIIQLNLYNWNVLGRDYPVWLPAGNSDMSNAIALNQQRINRALNLASNLRLNENKIQAAKLFIELQKMAYSILGARPGDKGLMFFGWSPEFSNSMVQIEGWLSQLPGREHYNTFMTGKQKLIANFKQNQHPRPIEGEEEHETKRQKLG